MPPDDLWQVIKCWPVREICCRCLYDLLRDALRLAELGERGDLRMRLRSTPGSGGASNGRRGHLVDKIAYE